MPGSARRWQRHSVGGAATSRRAASRREVSTAVFAILREIVARDVEALPAAPFLIPGGSGRVRALSEELDGDLGC